MGVSDWIHLGAAAATGARRECRGQAARLEGRGAGVGERNALPHPPTRLRLDLTRTSQYPYQSPSYPPPLPLPPLQVHRARELAAAAARCVVLAVDPGAVVERLGGTLVIEVCVCVWGGDGWVRVWGGVSEPRWGDCACV